LKNTQEVPTTRDDHDLPPHLMYSPLEIGERREPGRIDVRDVGQVDHKPVWPPIKVRLDGLQEVVCERRSISPWAATITTPSFSSRENPSDVAGGAVGWATYRRDLEATPDSMWAIGAKQVRLFISTGELMRDLGREAHCGIKVARSKFTGPS